MYESEEACLNNSQEPITTIALTANHRASAIKRKNYAAEPGNIVEFHSFYIEEVI